MIYSELGDIDHALEWADKTLKIAPAGPATGH